MRSSTSTDAGPRLRTGRRVAAAHVLLALPVLAATAVIIGLAAGDSAGRAPWLDARPRNSAEAAAVGNAPVMLQLIRAGEDPGRVHALRRGMMSRGIVFATTPEAALWSGQADMIRLLDREGAIGDDVRLALGCLADDLDLTEAADYLAPSRACRPGSELERLQLRSRINAGAQHD
jgi:hypothetical protein